MIAALDLALAQHSPACAGDAAFTSDEVKQALDARLAAVCRRCPLFAECEADARADRPAWGFWAGKRYGQGTRRDRAEHAPRKPSVPALPPEPSRPVAVGDEFENLGRTGARRLIVTEIAALGDATFLEYEILAADPSAKQGWQVGDRQHIIPNALRDPTKYRLVAHIP